jgi:hypothetical protein
VVKRCPACEFRTTESTSNHCPDCGRELVTSLLESSELAGPDDAIEAPPQNAPPPAWVLQSYSAGSPPKGIWETLSDNGLGWILLFVLLAVLGFAAQDWLVSPPSPPPADTANRSPATPRS